jgi:phosphoenolpyruvate phosphomutase
MWLTRELIDDDIILLHGDMVFESLLAKRLVEGVAENAVLINKRISPPEKDFKAIVENEIIREIGVNLSGPNAFFCAPFYKFSKAGFLKWMSEIETFVMKGKVRCYAEDAFNSISNEIGLRPVYFTDEFCMEIDTFEDISKARAFYMSK